MEAASFFAIENSLDRARDEKGKKDIADSRKSFKRKTRYIAASGPFKEQIKPIQQLFNFNFYFLSLLFLAFR